MVPLCAQFAPSGDALGPGDHHAVAGAAVVAGDLLGPLEGRAHGMGPRGGIVVVGLPGSDLIHASEHVLQVLGHAVEEGHFVEQALKAAFGAGAVVARDVDDDGVVELAGFANGVDDSTHVVIGLLEEPRVNLHEAGVDLLLLGREGVPRDQARRERVELGVRRDHAQLLLACECFFADLVPPLIELALVLGDPLGLGMVRGMSCAGRVVAEEGFVRRHRLLHGDPLDGLVGHVIVEVVIGITQIWLDRLGSFGDVGPPLIGVAADEAVEVIKAQAGRPEVKRSGLAGLPVGDVVVLAEPCGAIAVLLEHLSDGRGVLEHHRVVAGEAGGGFGDDTSVHGMVIAAGDQCGSGRAAQRGGVELVELEAVVGQHLERRSIAGAAECAGRPEPDIVEQNQQDVGRALGCLHGLGKVGNRLFGAKVDGALERLLGSGQNVLGDRRSREA